jgi:hypothetical protein
MRRRGVTRAGWERRHGSARPTGQRPQDGQDGPQPGCAYTLVPTGPTEPYNQAVQTDVCAGDHDGTKSGSLRCSVQLVPLRHPESIFLGALLRGTSSKGHALRAVDRALHVESHCFVKTCTALKGSGGNAQ